MQLIFFFSAMLLYFLFQMHFIIKIKSVYATQLYQLLKKVNKTIKYKHKLK